MKTNKTTPAAHLPGPSFHVEFDHVLQGWTVGSDDNAFDPIEFSDHDDAVRRACQLAQQQQSAVYVHGDRGAIVEKYELFGSQAAIDGAFHVIPFEGSWAVTRHGVAGVFERFATKREAVDAARDRARDTEGLLVIHLQSGVVQEEHDYSS